MRKVQLLFVVCLLSFAGHHTVRAQGIPSGYAQADTATEGHARIVKYAEQDVVSVRTKLRYTTLIILPKEEQILDFTCGDKEYWAVNGGNNLAYVKPAKASAQTNVNLITASGNVYSFALREVSDDAKAEPDLKIFVEPRDESLFSSANSRPRFVSADDVADCREQAAAAKTEARETRELAEKTVETRIGEFLASYPSSLEFDYRFPLNRKPFFVTAIYHDGRFTYIRANARELPALYEVKDGKPNLIHFEYRNGTFIAGKVIDQGYLAIGKARMHFFRKE